MNATRSGWPCLLWSVHPFFTPRLRFRFKLGTQPAGLDAWAHAYHQNVSLRESMWAGCEARGRCFTMIWCTTVDTRFITGCTAAAAPPVHILLPSSHFGMSYHSEHKTWAWSKDGLLYTTVLQYCSAVRHIHSALCRLPQRRTCVPTYSIWYNVWSFT